MKRSVHFGQGNFPKTTKRSIHFGQDNFPKVIKAIRSLGDALIRLNLNRGSGIVTLEVEMGTTLEAFEDFSKGEGVRHDRRLKAKIRPLGSENGPTLQELHNLALGDFSEEIIQVNFQKGEFLTFVFKSIESKRRFIETFREPYLGLVTIRG